MEIYARLRPAASDQPGGPSAISEKDIEGKGHCRGVFTPQASQAQVIEAVLVPQLKRFLENDEFSCVFLAYGQTGSGKTHTIFGPPGVLTETEYEAHMSRRSSPTLLSAAPSSWGLFPFAAVATLEALSGSNAELKISAVEVYMDRIYDLLNNKAAVQVPGASSRASSRRMDFETTTRDENGKWVIPSQWESTKDRDARNRGTPGAKCEVVKTATDVVQVVRLIEATRSAQSHALNLRSSRSHCIITVSVRQVDSGGTLTSSQLQFVDLAGSERVYKSGVSADQHGGANSFSLRGGVTVDIPKSRFDEAKAVNLSLSALGRVIAALARKDKFVSFRDCTLTQLMKDTLSGRGVSERVVLMLALRRESSNDSETNSTLRFGAVCAGATSSESGEGSTGASRRKSSSSMPPVRRRSSVIKRKQTETLSSKQTVKEALQQAYANLEAADRDIATMKAQGKDEHVNSEGFASGTIKSFLENKEKFERYQQLIPVIKQQIAEVKSKAAQGMGDGQSQLDRLDAQLKEANHEVWVTSGIYYRQVTTGIWQARDKRLQERMNERDAIVKEIAFLSGDQLSHPEHQ